MTRFYQSPKQLIKKALLTQINSDLEIARRFNTSVEHVKLLKIELKKEGKLK